MSPPLAFCLGHLIWLASNRGLSHQPWFLSHHRHSPVRSLVTSSPIARTTTPTLQPTTTTSSTVAFSSLSEQPPTEGSDLHSRAAKNFDLLKHILYHDDHIVVVDKPSGFLCVPGVFVRDSLASRVAQHFAIPDMARSVVHRLDQSTSGVVVFARNEGSLKKLHKQFSDRLVRKGYLALVDGVMAEDQGQVDLAIRKDLDNPPKQIVDSDLGKPSLTKWKVAQRGENRTLVHLVPQTGRTHQLRVHMTAIGHPILGDELYAPPPVRTSSPRLCLHAQVLRFQHPHTLETLTFTAPPPFTIDPPTTL